jgi:hypothetical protein
MSLPSVEERKWLGRYLRKLIELMGAEQFRCAAIVQPSPRYFPTPGAARSRMYTGSHSG